MKNKIKYQFYRFMCNLTFGKLKQHYLVKKNNYRNVDCIHLQNQQITNINVVGENNVYDEEKICKNNIELIINGNNNVVELEFDTIKGIGSKKLIIHIYGDNNIVHIGKELVVQNCFKISLAYHPHKTNNSKVYLGDKFGTGTMEIMLLENNSSCVIGNNCMFADDILIRLSDTHSVLDLDGNLLNYGGNVEIGNAVWCGREVRILKNVSIGDNSIIGASSVVTKRFDESNIVIGGNPAKIIKRGVKWSGLTPQSYLDSQNLSSVEM